MATRPPESYTPKYLAEKILISRAALEGERKQVTVLFADLKSSMELSSTGAPASGRTRWSTSLPRRRCFARWTCGSGSTARKPSCAT
jgi:hypothetical protein